jgi:hypothetical protein
MHGVRHVLIFVGLFKNQASNLFNIYHLQKYILICLD